MTAGLATRSAQFHHSTDWISTRRKPRITACSPPQSHLGRLLAAPVRRGCLEWIGVRPGRRVALEALQTVTMTAGAGIKGDRYRTSHEGPRQVTLIAAEDLAAIAAFMGRSAVAPDLLRRNLVTSGINLLALKDLRFRVGTELLPV